VTRQPASTDILSWSTAVKASADESALIEVTHARIPVTPDDPRWRPRFAWVILGLLPIVLATLSPQPEQLGIAAFTIDVPRYAGAWRDVAQNVALYIPFGLALAARRVRFGAISLIAAALSASIEVLQLYVVPGRYPAGLDIITNTAGAQLGALAGAIGVGGGFRALLHTCERYLAQSLRADPRAASRLALAWTAFVSTAVIATGWLLAPAPPPPYFYAVAGPYLDPGGGALRIGSDEDPSARFNGLIDEIRIYSTARTTAEIRMDMMRPVRAEAPDPSLIAAYSFDEGAGSRVADESGRGHDGTIAAANWVREGRFGPALSFDGRTSGVVIPAASDLDLREAMTLEAWVFPMGAPGRWPAIVSRDGDAYFLVASSEGRPLRAVVGGRFSDVAEFVSLWRPIERGQWTHLAGTFDGQTLRMYVNGVLARAQVHWSTHHPHGAELNGTPLPFGRVDDPRRFQTAILGDFRLRFTLACGSSPARGPVFSVAGLQSTDLLTVRADGRDLWVNWSSRAQALGLASPGYRARGALRDCDAGRDVALAVLGPLPRLRVERNGEPVQGSGPGPFSGWAFVIHAELVPAWAQTVLTVSWIAVLFGPLGFWTGRDLRAVAMALVVVGAVLISQRLWRVAPPDVSHMALAALSCAAGLSGRVLTDSWRRASAASPS
jgi:VanZ family protein